MTQDQKTTILEALQNARQHIWTHRHFLARPMEVDARCEQINTAIEVLLDMAKEERDREERR